MTKEKLIENLEMVQGKIIDEYDKKTRCFDSVTFDWINEIIWSLKDHEPTQELINEIAKHWHFI